MEYFNKPTLVRQVACSPEEVNMIDHIILEDLRQKFYQDHKYTKKSDWIRYARLREPDRTRGRAEFA